jgi:hypothetical protein
MLKSFLSFVRNGAHLKKDVWKKQGLSILEVNLSALNMQKHFWFVSRIEHVNLAIKKNFKNNLWWFKWLCFTCDLSNIQKCSFKECPLTWVASFTKFLP